MNRTPVKLPEMREPPYKNSQLSHFHNACALAFFFLLSKRKIILAKHLYLIHLFFCGIGMLNVFNEHSYKGTTLKKQ